MHMGQATVVDRCTAVKALLAACLTEHFSPCHKASCKDSFWHCTQAVFCECGGMLVGNPRLHCKVSDDSCRHLHARASRLSQHAHRLCTALAQLQALQCPLTAVCIAIRCCHQVVPLTGVAGSTC